MNSVTFTKDPNATLDYAVDWTAWLGTDTIASAVWIVPTGITKVSESITPQIAQIWVSGGTVDLRYPIVCHMTTAAGRTDDRTITLLIADR